VPFHRQHSMAQALAADGKVAWTIYRGPKGSSVSGLFTGRFVRENLQPGSGIHPPNPSLG
jgi:hypothetical protein